MKSLPKCSWEVVSLAIAMLVRCLRREMTPYFNFQQLSLVSTQQSELAIKYFKLGQNGWPRTGSEIEESVNIPDVPLAFFYRIGLKIVVHLYVLYTFVCRKNNMKRDKFLFDAIISRGFLRNQSFINVREYQPGTRHASRLKEALARPGVREILQVYENYQEIDKGLDPYSQATKPLDIVKATNHTLCCHGSP